MNQVKSLLIAALLIFCLNIRNTQSLPLDQNSTSTVKEPIGPPDTTKPGYDIYDEYDENYYKDYYNDDYLNEIAEEKEKEASLKMAEKPLGKNNLSTTSRVPILVPVRSTLSQKSNQNSERASKSSVIETATPEYDLSEYYDDYKDYYDENYHFDAAEEEIKAELPNVIKAKEKVNTSSVKNEALAADEYQDYYDYSDEKSTTPSATPSLKLNKITTNLSRTIDETKKTTTSKPELLEKSTNTKNTPTEYDEYYEDEYYQDNEKDKYDYYGDDYYADDYQYDYQEKNSNLTTTNTNLVTTNRTAVNVTTTTEQPLFDEYDENNYDDYNDWDENNYDYGDIFDEVTKKPENTKILEEVVYEPVTSTKSSKPIIIIPDIMDQTLNKALETPIPVPTTKKPIVKPISRPTIKSTTQPSTTLKTTSTTIIETTSTHPTTSETKFEDTFYYKETEYIIPNLNEDNRKQPEAKSNYNITSLKGDLKLKELIKSPALLAGIFGGLLLGLITALLLLIFIIYRIRQRKYDERIQYDLDTKLNNEKKKLTKDHRRSKEGKIKKPKKRVDKSKLVIDSADLNNQNLLSSSQLSTPSNNASGSTNSNTGLLNGHNLVNNSRLLKYATNTNTNSLRIVSSVLSSNESTGSPNNHEGSFNYAYIKAPTKEFYA